MKNTKLLHPLARNSGNTLVEYGFIGTAVVASSMVILMLFGSDLNALFLGIKKEAQNHISNASSTIDAQGAQASSIDAIQNDIGKALMNGASNASTIEVTAANGSTQYGLFAKTPGRYKVSPTTLSVADILAMERDMSNRTFMLADLERQMKDMLIYANGDPAKFMHTSIMFQGQSQPALTLAIGLQYEAQILQQMQAKLKASNASSGDKAKMDTLVASAVGAAASIYGKAQALQSTYESSIAKAKIEVANKAIQAAKASTVNQAANVSVANQAIKDAQTAQSVASTAAAQASTAAQTAAASGTPTDITQTIAKTDTTAGIMCKTGAGQTHNSQCNQGGGNKQQGNNQGGNNQGG